MVYWNYWPDLRAEVFKEIYEHPIYPPNLFLERPPDSFAQKMAGEAQSFKYLYERGTLTRPSSEVPSLEERMKRAQKRGALKE